MAVWGLAALTLALLMSAAGAAIALFVILLAADDSRAPAPLPTVAVTTMRLEAATAPVETPLPARTVSPPTSAVSSTPAATQGDSATVTAAAPTAPVIPSPTSAVPSIVPSSIPPLVGQHAYSLTVQVEARTARVNYLLYLPPDYGQDPQTRWPLVLFLHGVGERGRDPLFITHQGLPKLVKQGQEFPFILLSPQCPPSRFWADVYPEVMALLDHVQANYAVDPQRLYLTGVSMGGYGAVGLAGQYPDRFAALVPIAGGYAWDPNIPFAGYYTRDANAPVPESICALKDIPAWFFHGAQDAVIPPSQSEQVVNALRACGGQPNYTRYPGADHVASWELAYADAALYEWLLHQTRK